MCFVHVQFCYVLYLSVKCYTWENKKCLAKKCCSQNMYINNNCNNSNKVFIINNFITKKVNLSNSNTLISQGEHIPLSFMCPYVPLCVLCMISMYDIWKQTLMHYNKWSTFSIPGCERSWNTKTHLSWFALRLNVFWE